MTPSGPQCATTALGVGRQRMLADEKQVLGDTCKDRHSPPVVPPIALLLSEGNEGKSADAGDALDRPPFEPG